MAGKCVYDNGLGAVVAGSSNVVSVTNMGAGLWDIVFAYVSRTANVKRFLVQSQLALGDVGACDGNAVTAIGADTITIRINTRSKAGADADKSFNVTFEELG